MSSRLHREVRFDAIIVRLRKQGRLRTIADQLRIPISTVEQWVLPSGEDAVRPSAEIQLEVIEFAEKAKEISP